MPTSDSLRIGAIVCALMTTSCAAWPPTSVVAPPRLTLPETAARPCELYRLPAEPTQADLEVGYLTRGAQIVTCDAARRLAVETLLAEREAQDRARSP